MLKSETIVRYTAEEIDEIRRGGGDLTDYARLDALSDEEIEASIDREEEGEFDRSTLRAGIPQPKQKITVRLDSDVIEWFRSQGSGYQVQMNDVLKNYMEAQKLHPSATTPRR